MYRPEDYESLHPRAVADCQKIGTEFLEAFTQIEAKETSVHFMPLVITTITFTGTYAMRSAAGALPTIPIEDIRLAIVADPDTGAPLGVAMDPEKTTKRQRSDAYVREIQREKRRFRRHLPLRCRGKSVKLFYNGSLHITGCSSAIEFLEIASQTAEFIGLVTRYDVLLTLEAMRVQMINCGTVVVDSIAKKPIRFPPRALSMASRALGVPTDFESERHPGVKFPISVDGQKVSTVCVFQTGNVSIIGSRSPADVARAFLTVAYVLDELHTLGEPNGMVRTTTTRKKLDLMDGYPRAMYLVCCD
jgi:TATA-box binding protein (TBP) (component of TFIID and TFIIIB)